MTLSKIKKITCFLIFYSGLLYIFQLLAKITKRETVRILVGHRVIDERTSERDGSSYLFMKSGHGLSMREFERKCRYLKRNYNIISLHEAIDRMRKGGMLKRYVVLTFDDGYRDAYDNIFPLLKKYDIPATFFLITRVIDKGEPQWFDKLIMMVSATKVDSVVLQSLQGREYKLNNSINQKIKMLSDLSRALKIADDSIINEVLIELQAKLKVNDKNESLYLTWKQIKEMVNSSGLISIGAHTVTHPNLIKIPYERAAWEVTESKREIEEKAGQHIDCFSYPYGEFNDKIRNIVTNNGFLCACATGKGVNTDLYALRRISLGIRPFYVFAVEVSGMLDWLRLTKRKIEAIF